MIKLNDRIIVSSSSFIVDDKEEVTYEFVDDKSKWQFVFKFVQIESASTKVESINKDKYGEIIFTNIPSHDGKYAVDDLQVGGYKDSDEKLYFRTFIERMAKFKKIDCQFMRGK